MSGFDVAEARQFVADNHSAFDELPEPAERWLAAALDEIERLREQLDGIAHQADALIDAAGVHQDIEEAAWNRLVDLVDAWKAGR